jgi:hypothetical protein
LWFFEENDRHYEEDPKPALVTSCVPIGSIQEQEVVQEKASPKEILFGWTRTKLEPDWKLSTRHVSGLKSGASYFAADYLGREERNKWSGLEMRRRLLF